MHYVRLARVYASSNRVDEAIEVYLKAIAMDPGDRNACQELAQLYLSRQDLDAAEKIFKQILRYTSRKWEREEIENQILDLYRQQGKLREKLEQEEAEGTS